MKAKERIEQLQELMDALEGDDLWQRWLKGRRHHRRRSWRNQLLIAIQRPDTACVEGYTVWREKFNRQVAKGAKAVWILAPSPVKIEVEDEATGQVTPSKKLFFKPVTVFALEDTVQIEGRPEVPVAPPLLPAVGESHAHYFGPLRDVALITGIAHVGSEEMPANKRGYYRPSTKAIAINRDCSGNEAVKVLTHELAHHLVRGKLEREDWPDTYATEEVLVEATAYCVCTGIGLDVGDYSAKYVQAWGADDLTQIIMRVDELASEIETGLEARMQNSHEPAIT